MGFLSNIFGGKKEDNVLKEAFHRISRILEDEQFQLEMINPMLKKIILTAPAYDCDPNGKGPFGLSEQNPIPVNGPIGELTYFSKLKTVGGDALLFHRIGAMEKIDVFEAVTFSGSEWFIFFVDFYHPRRSRATPDGLLIVKEVRQFSGFNSFCENFPYDFVEMKQSMQESGLSRAYIPISQILQQIQSGAYKRPLAHNAKLDLLKSRLINFSSQIKQEETKVEQRQKIIVDGRHKLISFNYDFFYIPIKLVGQKCDIILRTTLPDVTVFMWMILKAKSKGWSGGNSFVEIKADNLINRRLESGMCISSEEAREFVSVIESQLLSRASTGMDLVQSVENLNAFYRNRTVGLLTGAICIEDARNVVRMIEPKLPPTATTGADLVHLVEKILVIFRSGQVVVMGE